MVERLRVFKGATELNVSDAFLTFTNDVVVNRASVTFEAEDTVLNSSIIDFTKSDGSTTVISGQIDTLKKPDFWTAVCLTNGYELNNTRVEKVYVSGTSPEDIVQDVIDNFTTNLTYAGTATSGFTITGNYVAKAYAIDVIKDMMDLLEWQLRIDVSNNVYFEPKGDLDNGYVFTDGENGFSALSWEEDKTEMINHLKVIGGFQSYSTEETVSGTGTEFTLSSKPQGVLKAVVSGVEIAPANYSVDADNKKVTFTSSRTNPTFFYEINIPISVETQNDASIALHGERFKEITAPWLNDYSEARKYAQTILLARSNPKVKCNGVSNGLDFFTQAGETVRVVDTLRGWDRRLVIIKKTIYAKGRTTYEFGERDFVLSDWQREVEERIKKLERKLTNDEEVTFARLFSHDMRIGLEIQQTCKYNYANDSFTIGHQTLGRIRSSVDFEPDCSDTGNHGTWQGSGSVYDSMLHYWSFDTDGTDYGSAGNNLTASGASITTGKLGNCYEFNGSSDYLYTAASIALMNQPGLTFAMWIYFDGQGASDIDRIFDWSPSGKEIKIDIRDDISGALLFAYSDGTGAQELESSTIIPTGEWVHVVCTIDSSSAQIYINGVLDATSSMSMGSSYSDTTPLYVGSYNGAGLFYDGKIDEFIITNYKATEGDVNQWYVGGVGRSYAELGMHYSLSGFRLGSGYFNGVNNTLLVPHDTTLNPENEDFTIFLALRTKSTASDLISRKGTSGTAPIIFIEHQASGILQIGLEGTGGTQINAAMATAVNDGNWHDVFIIVDRTAETVDFYLDGVFDVQRDLSSVTIGNINPSQDLYIGSAAASSGWYTGFLDEYMFWKGQKLSEAEMTQVRSKFVGAGHALLTNMKLWLSFDNPRIGDRSSVKFTVV